MNQVNTNFVTLTHTIINNHINNPDSSDYIEVISPPISNWEFPEGANYKNNNMNNNFLENTFSQTL